LIRANGTANLFLLNPNGIIFGPNASLNIGGSFVGTTASSLNFADGKQFSATNPQFPPLLTVSVPIGLQFGKNPGSILNQSVVVDSFGIPIGLQVQPGKSLALVGGDVMLEGGNLTAYAGRIELGSVAGPSLVSLAPTASGWALGYEGVQNFRDIQLSQAATVDASGEGGGDIQVQGRRIEVRDGSVIGAFTIGSLSGGTLTVNASDSVELIGTTVDGKMPSGLFTQALSTGDAGNLTIATGQLIVRNGAQVSASTVAEGQGGSLAVAASESVELTGTSTNGQFSSGLFAEAEGAGAAGSLDIKTRRLIVRDAAEVNVSNQGLGDAGELMVQVRDLMLENFGELTAESASGQGGNISQPFQREQMY
jgi:large exoprotein involved in heme utilization and adhesion